MKLYGQTNEPETAAELPVVEPAASDSQSCIEIDKIDDVVYKFAKCCNPLPGDDIIGFITRGHGISIHAKNCINYQSARKRNDPEEMQRWMAVKWKPSVKVTKIPTGIEVLAEDRVGLVFDITKVLVESHVLILNSSSRRLKNGNAIFEASVQVDGTDQLNNLMDKMRKIKSVISVERARK
jgi:GTP pyrophosphokinase